jgi:hypothetical protein
MQVMGETISGVLGLLLSMTWCQPAGMVTATLMFAPTAAAALHCPSRYR